MGRKINVFVREERMEVREIELVKVRVVCCSFVVGGRQFGSFVVGGDWLVQRPYCVYVYSYVLQ